MCWVYTFSVVGNTNNVVHWLFSDSWSSQKLCIHIDEPTYQIVGIRALIKEEEEEKKKIYIYKNTTTDTQNI